MVGRVSPRRRRRGRPLNSVVRGQYVEDRELLWRQYNQAVELYKFYLDLVIKLNVFYYAVTGAILSFVVGHLNEPNYKYAVLLPLLMSVGLAIVSFYAAGLVPMLRREIQACSGALALKTYPEVRPLIALLIIFGVMFLAVVAGCAFIICKY
jgi:hypothetical protein